MTPWQQHIADLVSGRDGLQFFGNHCVFEKWRTTRKPEKA